MLAYKMPKGDNCRMSQTYPGKLGYMGYGQWLWMTYQGEEASSFLSFESRGEILDSLGDPLSLSISRSRSLRLSKYVDMMPLIYFP